MPSERANTILQAELPHPYELPSIEYKESGKWDELRHGIARTALAMANLADGGFIVIGVAQRTGLLQASGVLDEDLASFQDDDVNGFIGPFGRPQLQVRGERLSYNGKWFYVIEVTPFERVPVISAKDSPPNTRQGVQKARVYARSLSGKVETRVATVEDMELILRLAVEKRLREYVETAGRAGIHLTVVAPKQSDPFQLERGDL